MAAGEVIMPRKPRLDYPGAIHHVVSRGVRKREVFLSVADHIHWLNTLAETCLRHGLTCLAYCLMGNHYHLLIQSNTGKLSPAIQLLNSHYAQHFNGAHGLVGHVFQRRFHAELVDRDGYLREVIRYVLLNPVRAGLVTHPDQWPWSSYAETIGTAEPHSWLAARRVLGLFGSADGNAPERFERFLLAGVKAGTQAGTQADTQAGTQAGSDPAYKQGLTPL
jgi:REP element-mobilizing transposase RayT